MPLITAQPASREKDALSVRLDRVLHQQLKAYAEFIASSKDYIISQALQRVFRQDRDFAAWLSTRPDLTLDAGIGGLDASATVEAQQGAKRRRTAAESV